MSYKKSQETLRDMILAGYPLIYVVTDDERPVIETLRIIANGNKKKHHLYSWNQTTGIFHENGSSHNNGLTDPNKALEFSRNYTANGIFVLHDYHNWMKETETVLKMKDAVLNITVPITSDFALRRYEEKNGYFYKTIVITSRVLHVPEELNKLMSVVHFGLPGRKEIERMLDTIIQTSKENRKLSKDERDKIIESSIGLTETEIFNAYSKSMVMHDNKIIAKVISSEKSQIIKKDGLLEFYEPKTGLNDVGGLKNLIHWVRKRKMAFDEEIREKRRLELPKGLLITGIQGCGKSYSAKAIANFLELPLIRLDIGAMMGKWVGESEENIRRAIKLAESIAPCVLWMEEIDKAIPNISSGNTHEVSKRVVSTLLTWLQEKEKPVFVVATANNIEQLPPELMRKGRFDEIFFADLPNTEERVEIFKIHLGKRGFDPEDFDLNEAAASTEGFSGSEIEVLINEANFEAAYQNEEMQTVHLIQEAKNTNPLSKTMAEKINAIRKWAKDHNVRGEVGS